MFLSLFSNFYIQVWKKRLIGIRFWLDCKYKSLLIPQAYIKRRRLPTVKKDGDAANGKVANGKSKDKVTSHNAEKEKRDVGKMITNIMTNTSNACYIGQNGLYQSTDKAKSNGSSSEKKKHM